MKSKVYTKTGDAGSTSLVGGTRVSKTDARLEAYGTIDELNAHLGWLLELLPPDGDDKEVIHFIQNRLFVVGAQLATEHDSPYKEQMAQLEKSDILRIEHRIDEVDAQLPKHNQFVLPSGSMGCAAAHICRTVCRRAERCICSLAEQHTVDTVLLQFINRLSDYLFVLSRFLVINGGREEIFWNKSCK